MFDTTDHRQLSFRATHNQFHEKVLNALSDENNGRRAKDRLSDQIQNGVYDSYSIRTLPGFEVTSLDASREALLNVLDFFFEALVLPSMNDAQLFQYFSAIETSMVMRGPINGSYGRGLLVETIHHNAIFSIGMVLARELGRQAGKNRMILVHQGDRPEPRLDLIGRILQKYCNMQCYGVPMKGAWFKQLKQLMTPTTAVIYLADMPVPGVETNPQSGAYHRNICLSLENAACVVSSVSAVSKLSKILKVDHITMDFPDRGTVELISDVDLSMPLRCPFQDWAFGPAVKFSPGP